jgi:acetate kinase
MGSRAGDIDSAALLELMRVKNFGPSEMGMYLNTNGGLMGLAGESDIRQLLDKRSQKDAVSTQALEVFSYNIQKAIASQTVTLGGVDVLVLTGTALVDSPELRSLVLSNLSHLGTRVSDIRNNSIVGKSGVISVRGSLVKVVVIKTNEMAEMDFIAETFK